MDGVCMVKDWKKKKLGDIAEIRMCKRIFSEQTSPTGEIPFFKIGTFGKEPDAYISRSLYEEFISKYSFPNKGDILLSAAGTLGRTVVYDGKPAYFQDSNIVWLEIDKNQICNEYLNHYYQVIVWASPEGSTISRLYNSIIRNTDINLPSLPEQYRIAVVLSDTDELITTLEKLIAKKRAIKQGTMQELLTGKIRLSGFSGKWVEQLMSNCLVFEVGYPFKSELFNQNNIGLRLIKNRDLKSDDQVYFTTEEYDPTYIVKNGDVLIGMDGDFIPCLWNKGTALLNQRVGRIKTINIDIRFAYYVLIKPLEELQNGTGATTVKHLSHTNVELLQIYIPPTIAEQTAIASILSDMDAEIDTLTAKLNKLRNIKQGMMSELLTGRIRLLEQEMR